jgi:hypothetical protein
MQQAFLFVYMLPLSLLISAPIWGLPALAAFMLLHLRKPQSKPWQRAYTAAAAGGLLVGAVVGWWSYFYADFVLRILGCEPPRGHRPPLWLHLATPTGALSVAVASSLILLLAVAIAHGIARLSGGRKLSQKI